MPLFLVLTYLRITTLISIQKFNIAVTDGQAKLLSLRAVSSLFVCAASGSASRVSGVCLDYGETLETRLIDFSSW